MKPDEYANRLTDYLSGPDPKDPNAPLTEEEQELVEAQGERLARAEDS